MDRKAVLFLALTLVLALSGLGLYALAAPKKGDAMPETTLIVATDPHYIAPSLTDHGEYFENMIHRSDGKVMEYIEELTDAFLDEVIDAAPDALILSGDLTFNGARESHEALAEKLRAVTDAGIPVLVIPGNHDLDRADAARFSGGGFTRVPSVNAAEFADIYRGFGFAQAIAADGASLSYMAEISPALRVLMLDVNTADSYNRVKPETLAWVEEQLRDAADAGAKVIAVSHQNVYRHNRVIYSGYVIENADELLALYGKYGVPVNLSGHLHCQHIVRGTGFAEIATSSLAVNPCQYGVLTLDGRTITYGTKPVDVSAWAAVNACADPALLDFASYARDFFLHSGRTVIDASDPDAAELTRFFAELNLDYFAGRLDLVDPDDPMFDRWADAFGFEGQYILAIREEAGLDSTRLTLDF